MTQYPRDEFDDIDENTARRGAYRGRQDDEQTSNRGLVLIVLSGVLSLLVGGFMYVMSPRTDSPEASAQNGSPSATATATPSPDAGPTVDPSSVVVEVYNSSAPEGAAAAATQLIQDQGYTVRTTENWAGTYTLESTVNFATGASSEANAIADALGLPYIVQDYQAEQGLVYVVLGADFDPAALGVELESAAEETAESDPATDETETGETEGTTSEGQPLYTVDPLTGTFVELTEPAAPGQTLYIYSPANGGYIEYVPGAQGGTAEIPEETEQVSP